MSQTTQTSTEVLDSLTGFDEMAITQHFGHTITDLLNNDSSMYARALVFVLKRRDGAIDDDARNETYNMPLKDIAGYFAEESEESGKDEPVEQPSPETSLSSVS